MSGRERVNAGMRASKIVAANVSSLCLPFRPANQPKSNRNKPENEARFRSVTVAYGNLRKPTEGVRGDDPELFPFTFLLLNCVDANVKP